MSKKNSVFIYIHIYLYLHTSSRVQPVFGKILRTAMETKGELS